jgi:hypothetical protein
MDEKGLNMEFDKVIRKLYNGEIVDYGFIFGNEKIVFIKTGAGGSINGYRNKYLKMAEKIHDRLGATIICSSNHISSLELDRKAIIWCAQKVNNLNFELYLLGTSDGAYQCICLAKIQRTKKLVCINPSFIPSKFPRDKLILLSCIEKIFVFGTEDEEGKEIVSNLQKEYIPNLEIKMVEGADHSFTNMIDEFINLSDLI